MDKKCEVCSEAVAKYKCPGCMMRTCSLPCVKLHKIEQDCDGVRSKTEYLPIGKFTDINLLSDYRFLEEAGRKADASNRDNFENRRRNNWQRTKLIRQCKKHNIKLLSMPYHMTKRKQNESRFQFEYQTIVWTVDWIFPQASTKYRERVDDQVMISVSLQQYIHPTESDPVKRHQLKPYIQPPMDHIKVFMRVEGRKTDSIRYYELDKDKSLCDNLKDKLIIEHPTLYVVLADQASQYLLLEDGEEAQSDDFSELMSPSVDNPNNNHHSNNHHGNNRGKRNYRNRGRGYYRGPGDKHRKLEGATDAGEQS